MNADYSIQCLVGETLTDICFVMDYLQFGFNGSKLNCYSCPQTRTAEGVIAFPEKGSRDALCSFIGHDLVSIEVVDDVRLALCFTTGRIEVPLDLASRKSGDAAEFIPGDGRSWIVF